MSETDQTKSRFVSALGFTLPDAQLAPETIHETCTFGQHAGSLLPGYSGTDLDCQCHECRQGREHFGEYMHGSVPMGACGTRPAAWLIGGMFDLMMTLAVNYDQRDLLDGVGRFRRHAGCDFAAYATNPAGAEARKLMAELLADFLISFQNESAVVPRTNMPPDNDQDTGSLPSRPVEAGESPLGSAEPYLLVPTGFSAKDGMISYETCAAVDTDAEMYQVITSGYRTDTGEWHEKERSYMVAGDDCWLNASEEDIPLSTDQKQQILEEVRAEVQVAWTRLVEAVKRLAT